MAMGILRYIGIELAAIEMAMCVYESYPYT
jgi:hypothetical protein